MKNYIRKSLSILMLIAIILTSFSSNTIYAQATTIYESSTTQVITAGATLEKITRFTTDGWLSINVLRVDLGNPYIKVNTLTNSESISKLASVPVLAKSKGAVAAVNASFFSWGKEPGTAEPIGSTVESGLIVADSTHKPGAMATVSIDTLNNVLYNYWETDIKLIAPNGKFAAVARYNKFFSGQNDLSIMDKKLSKNSIGCSEKYPDIVEMVVDNGKVAEVRKQKPAVQIPDNGYVVIARGQSSKFLEDNFVPGDVVGLTISTNPDWSKLQMAVTGGAILVKDGSVPQQFSHSAQGTQRHPRTAIGSSKGGKLLFMVTVDGRQLSSIGMTQGELAQFMLKIGAYNALNFDGGGSTTMAARTPGGSNIQVVNSPSDGMARGVSTAVGVFSIALLSELAGLIIETPDSNVFVNTSREFTIKGVDRYFNPLEIKQEQVKWSVSGVKGKFAGNVFYPESVGEGIIKASAGNVTAQYSISVLSAPVQLTLSSKLLKVPLEQKASLSVIGINKNGYSASINPADVKWSVNNNLGMLEKGVFTAKKSGTGFIDASIGNTHAYCGVSVNEIKSEVKDSFEKENGSVVLYPENVKGNYQLAIDTRHSGKASGQLTYDFTHLEGARAAYLAFSGDGIALSPDTVKIGLWVYNTHENSNWVGSWVNDSKGNRYQIYFAKGMNWTGWKYLEVSLDAVEVPAKLTRIYCVQNSPVAESGSIYMDDLTVTTSNFPKFDISKLPKDTLPVDEANKAASYANNSDWFSFSVLGQAYDPGDKAITTKSILKNFTDKINKYISIGTFVGSAPHEVAKSVQKPVIATYKGYKSIDYKGSQFIQLDMSKGGLRTSNPNQWPWLLQQLDAFKGNNVFLFLANAPSTFNDGMESKLFQDILTKYKQKTGKNIIVFYNSSKNTSYMHRGIKYISSAGFDAEGVTAGNARSTVKYVLVKVKGSTVTYEFKPII